MKPFRLDRRTLLRGAGSVAIALPWLEAMAPVKESRAAGPAAKRFVGAFWPGGTVPEKFKPIGTETDFQLGELCAPLQSMQSKLVILQGLDMKCKSGEQDQAGMVAWLTGREQMLETGTTYPDGPASIDQELADVLGTPVLYQAVRWSTHDGAPGTPSASNTTSYRFENGDYAMVQPDIDPAATFERLFGKPSGSAGWRKSILDSVLGRYQRLSAKLGSRDRAVLEQHLEALRELELQIDGSCQPPQLVDTAGYNPKAFNTLDVDTDALIPKVGKLMMDMLVAALACELTSVAMMQWGDCQASFTLPWLGLNETQACYQDDCGYREPELSKIFTWYSSQNAYLLAELDKVDMGGHSLLDESVVFLGTHLAYPPEHTNTNMPFMLAGGGGGLVGNRYRDYGTPSGGRSHNDLLVSILDLFGDHQPTWGNPKFNTQPLGNLTT